MRQHIDQQRDGGGGGDEGIALQIEAQQGGGADTALIADQPSEDSGQRSGHPR